MIEYAYFALGISISQCILIGLTGIKLRAQHPHAWWLVALAISFTAYFLAPVIYKADQPYLLDFCLMITSAIPSIFLLICESIFQDNPESPALSKRLAIGVFLINVLVIILVRTGLLESGGSWTPFHKLVVLLPIFWSMWIILSGFRDDMVVLRLRYRLGFMVMFAVLIGGNIIVNDFTFKTWKMDAIGPLISSYLSAFALLALNGIGMINDITNLFQPIDSVRGAPAKQNPNSDIESESVDENEVYNLRLAKKLEQAMANEKAYLKEGMSLSQLAKLIGEPSYKLRLYINQSLDFRNFNSYLNRYRIEDAKKLLKDPEFMDEKIFAIALKVGFSSLSPFNRSFKEETGLTPSEFRKSKA